MAMRIHAGQPARPHKRKRWLQPLPSVVRRLAKAGAFAYACEGVQAGILEIKRSIEKPPL